MVRSFSLVWKGMQVSARDSAWGKMILLVCFAKNSSLSRYSGGTSNGICCLFSLRNYEMISCVTEISEFIFT